MRSIWERAAWKEGATASTFTKDSVTGKEKTEGTFFITMYVEPMCMVFLTKKKWHWGLFDAIGDKKRD